MLQKRKKIFKIVKRAMVQKAMAVDIIAVVLGKKK